jgi:hypothetical protein
MARFGVVGLVFEQRPIDAVLAVIVAVAVTVSLLRSIFRRGRVGGMVIVVVHGSELRE